jgi:hypothetical protein
MIEIAGLAVSGLNLALNLFKTAKDARSWEERDIEVDSDWLGLAIEKAILPGPDSDYQWMNESRVPSAELRTTYSPVIAHNDERRIRYRLFQGGATTIGGRLMLVKRISQQ